MLLSLLIVAGAEVGLRRVDPDRLIVYSAQLEGRHTVRNHLHYFGSPELVFMGSSRAVHGFDMPEVIAALQDRLGRRVPAASFALGGLNMPEMGPLLGSMFRNPPLPRVMVWGVDAEFLGGKEDLFDRCAVFWSFGDWFRARKQFGRRVDHLLPEVFRTFVAEHYATFCHRDRPLNLLKELFRGRAPSAMRGETARPQDGSADQTYVNRHPDYDAKLVTEVRDGHLQPDGTYPFRAQRISTMRELLEKCRQQGVRVLLLELPNTDDFRARFPPDVAPRFDAEMRRIAALTGARYVSQKDLGLTFDDSEFRDPWHLNRVGALKLSRALVDRALAGFISEGDRQERP